MLLTSYSLGVKSACSSSLVALHTAFRDLQAGEATSAIVGGVNMLLSPSCKPPISLRFDPNHGD